MSSSFDLSDLSVSEISRLIKKEDLTMEQKYWVELINGKIPPECLEGVGKFITHISFKGCSFEGINFDQRTFFNCQFVACSLQQVNFWNCGLEGVVFRQCQVTAMDFRIKEGSFGSFYETSLEGFVTNQKFEKNGDAFDFKLNRK